ncbi:HAL/PAL/TAL family ammonia-lyase [Advenella mimigardefordensis]|uniref:Phenylalanine/histidine ammonia-lyase n=1 Tax=Advenella mimigardefordensis (strain DSM 17166 / LMG 22922 / DPN7) TaxID=1247726 RepID=W0PAE5_ADVMD|nr:aromatic amino acid ammonia-lyase [Advenella mimigardefordensis]AHG62467.1 phenylalanine/histidine ammonia-lyase [Advenella mimigardefordensis DPN7]
MNHYRRLWAVLVCCGMLFVWRTGVARPVLELGPSHRLTLQEVREVALDHRPVTLSEAGMRNVRRGHEIVMDAALGGVPVYGLNVGVGWNKDHPVFHEVNGRKVLSDDLLTLSVRFNEMSLRAHAAGVGKPMSADVVRAGMLIRLNTFLSGAAGVQPEVASMYVDYLNHDITPVIPSLGTVGEADITLASHIGLAMIGEWDVFYQGKRLPAAEVMKQLNIAPLKPVGKDFLSILSTNSLTAGQATLAALDTQAFLDKQVRLFAFMLEGFNGNVAPFSETAVAARPYAAMAQEAGRIRAALVGSDLWRRSADRALQDPLSFRTMAYTLGVVQENLLRLAEDLQVQINASDDNPLVLRQAVIARDAAQSDQLRAYRVTSEQGEGAIYPTANFNFLPVASKVEYLNLSLAKLAESMVQQLIRLENPELTGLPRFLAAKTNHGHAFGAIQKPFVEESIRIKLLAQPASLYGATLAGNIEDTTSMSGLAVRNTEQILDALYHIAAFQLLEGAQALELRDGFAPSASSKALLASYRQRVPFIDQDMPYSGYIEESAKFWRAYR